MSSGTDVRVELQNFQGRPEVYTIKHDEKLDKSFCRIFGYTRIRDWAVFPAFAPYANRVVRDINLVFPEASWSDDALRQLHAAKVAEEAAHAGRWPGLPGHAPDDMVFKPYEHQKQGVAWAYWFIRAGIFFHPGLGKTKVTIDTMRLVLQSEGTCRTLVICPTPNLARNWESEFNKHAPGIFEIYSTATRTGSGRAKATRKNLYIRMLEHSERPNAVLITSYGHLVSDLKSVHNKSPLFKALTFDMTVVDESHYLQQPNSERTKSVLAAVRTRRRIALSGTPCLGDPRHLYAQLKYLSPSIVGTFHQYQTEFCQMAAMYRCKQCGAMYRAVETIDSATLCKKQQPPKNGCRRCASRAFSKVNTVEGYQNLELLTEQVGDLCLRKTLADCTNLPPRVVIDYPYSVDSHAMALYNEIVDEGVATLTAHKLEDIHAGLRVLRMLQTLSGFITYDETTYPNGPDFPVVEKRVEVFAKQPKYEALQTLLETILQDPANKVVLWGYYIPELNLCEGVLKKMGVEYVRVDGSTSNRSELQEVFNTDENCRVYLSQVSTGIGVTLNAANYVIYAGYSLNLGHYLQSRERNYRIGQTRTVTVYRMYVPDSIHDMVLAAMTGKENLAESVTSRALCVNCNFAASCIARQIKPFTADCVVAPQRVEKFKIKSRRLKS